MMLESNIQNSIRIALSPQGIVFRTNSGEFWQGKVVYSQEFKQNILINLRRVQGLPEGFSDLLFIGQNRVAFIETKNEVRKATPEQINFINRMKSLGHIAGIARSDSDALDLIK